LSLLSFILPKPKPEYYQSIHKLPIGVYSRIQEGESLELLVTKGSVQTSVLLDTWQDINRQIVNTFGANEEYIKLLQLKKEWCEMICKIWLEREKFEWMESFAFAKQKEIEALEAKIKKNNETTFAQTLANVSAKMNFRIDPNTTTVYEFYGYTEAIRNGR
jgi:hypothetical protein